ncbi:hypothetical protein QQX98_012087 [Neonectria punicea]|uniref:Protein OrfX2/OrfX3/P47 domain-containing protein n=1 Tax=Neonectria punicea TaxID=979145 RepID=A0ABR1GKC9_9HYPO
MTSTISTNGWDLVYATNYTNINAQIAAQWQGLITNAPSLSKITAALPNNKATLSLTTSPWQLTQGGSGSIASLVLPIETGSFDGIDGTYDLAGQSITITLSLQWVPQPDQIQFSITNNISTIEADLNGNTKVTSNIVQAFASHNVQLSMSATITVFTPGVCWRITDQASKLSFYVYVTSADNSQSLLEVYQYVVHSLVVKPRTPATPVTVITAGNITDEIDGPILMELIDKNIDENINEFNFVFAAVDVVSSLAKNDTWAWLQPTYNGYAVVEPLSSPTNDNCVFAILSMVNNNSNPDPVLQVDPGAIAPKCTSSLLISPTMFLQNMLAAGVASVFTGADRSNFAIDESNLSITNTSTVTWAELQLDSDTKATLTIDPKNFAMSVENDRITIQFSNLNYPLKELGVTVGSTDIVFTGQFMLGLKTGSNGNKTLWFDPATDQPNITDVTSVMNPTYYEVEKIMGYLNIGLSVIGIGAAWRAGVASKAASKTAEEAGLMEAGAGADEVQQTFKKILSDPGTRQNFVDQAGEDGLEMLNNTVVNIKKANIWGSVAKWSGTLAGLTGVASGEMQSLSSTLEEGSNGNWEHTPAFSNFADLAIARYSFGGLTNLNVETARLAESLQIGFTIE